MIQFVPNTHWGGGQYFLFLSPSFILIFPTFCYPPYLPPTFLIFLLPSLLPPFPLPTFLSCRTARDSEGPHSEPEGHSQHAPHHFRRSALLREVRTHQQSPEHAGYVLASGEHMYVVCWQSLVRPSSGMGTAHTWLAENVTLARTHCCLLPGFSHPAYTV